MVPPQELPGAPPQSAPTAPEEAPITPSVGAPSIAPSKDSSLWSSTSIPKTMQIKIVHSRLEQLPGFDPVKYVSPLFSIDTIVNPETGDFRKGYRRLLAMRLRRCISKIGYDQDFDHAALDRITTLIPDDLVGVSLQTDDPQRMELQSHELYDLLVTSQGPTTLVAELNCSAYGAVSSEVSRLYPSSRTSSSRSRRSSTVRSDDHSLAHSLAGRASPSVATIRTSGSTPVPPLASPPPSIQQHLEAPVSPLSVRQPTKVPLLTPPVPAHQDPSPVVPPPATTHTAPSALPGSQPLAATRPPTPPASVPIIAPAPASMPVPRAPPSQA